ncbi:metal ABC transporter solute-binding protein, Zn/Mn family [Nostoc sp. FACHB-110]|uniref:metal ABC transporter solute-binding protein, Zn/Mn family n=1 Tax=Nostoc sp. FACHB-110 TaxID=2692834 RepID=UPI0016832A2D|nr:zinc ABC transporter substrate-binding protein [Nostoc sp. FACHB-110]MBD2438177.1 zinc ABC transporter substrate-binding protein [Nostoc sp. FACHB-110]
MLNKLLLNISLRAVFVALVFGFVGCANQAASNTFTQTSKVDETLPNVVATTSVLCDLIKQVAENTVNLSCLIPPGTNPYSYEPTPSDRQAIEQANLIFYNGYNFEPNLIKIIKSTNNNAPKIAVAQVAVPKPQRFIENRQKVIDPHVWHNAKNGITMVDIISKNLNQLVPNNADIYKNNTKQINNELTQLDSWIKTRIATIPNEKRKLITSHNALAYYAKAYSIPLLGVVAGVNRENNLTNTQLNNLVKNLRKTEIPTIFTETTNNSQLIQSVAQAAEVKVSERGLYTDGLGEPKSDGDTYQKMLEANTRTIVEGLGGTYLIFQPQVSN